MKTIAIAALMFGLACLAVTAQAQTAVPAPETQEQRDARMAWFRDAKFGLFIHWGVYAVPAGTYGGKQIPGIGEWIMRRAPIPVAEYRAYAKQFNPVKYDPEAWAELAKEAGMRYVVITSKHHDGFALYPSKVTDWDIADASPYGKDLLGPLTKAVRTRGLKMGFYYSQAQDWTHPGGAKSGLQEGQGWDEAHKGSFDEYLQKIAAPQVRELLTTYQPEILWWDTPTWMTKERALPLYNLISLRPGLITNNRLQRPDFPGDTDTPEQHIPATGIPGRDWEVCMTMNDTWGFKSYDHNWKTTEDLVRKLVDIVSKGGNFLLNVGPTAEGEIPQPSIERLKEVGRWMKVNGEAIYGTTASPFSRLVWGRATTKLRSDGATLYLHVFDWPKDGKLTVPGLRSRVRAASLLGGAGEVKLEATGDQVVLGLPAQAPSPHSSVVRLEIAGPLEVKKLLPTQGPDGTLTLSAIHADIHNVLGTDAKLEEKYGAPSVGYWTDARANVTYTFQIDKPGTFEVTAELAAQDAGAKLQVVNGRDASPPVEAPNTGDYRKFQATTLGRVTFTKAGDFELLIRPVAAGWKPVNMRTVTLKPVR